MGIILIPQKAYLMRWIKNAEEMTVIASEENVKSLNVFSFIFWHNKPYSTAQPPEQGPPQGVVMFLIFLKSNSYVSKY